MRKREVAACLPLVFVSYVIALAGAASFMALVGCGPHKGATCPPPRHALTDNGGQTPGNACEVRR